MPNPYPTALRERAVRAYEGSAETYAAVAAPFSSHINALVRWVHGARDRGTPNVSGDGKRFLLFVQSGQEEDDGNPLTVVLNWQAGLKPVSYTHLRAHETPE